MTPSDLHPEIRSTAPMWRRTYAIFAALLLATPLVAMQFTGEVDWSAGDFVIFGAMLAVLGLLLEGAARIGRTLRARAVLMGAAVFAFLLVWAELAVGIFD